MNTTHSGKRWFSSRKLEKAGLVTVIFILTDYLLLTLLPYLGLSFGGIAFPFTVFAIARLGIFLFEYLPRRFYQSNNRLTPKHIHWGFILFLILNLGMSALIYDGFYIEPFNLQVTHLTQPSPAITGKNKLRIVHVSDLHIERTTGRERNLIPLINAQKPDMIVLTGDYLNLSYLNDPISQQNTRDFLNQLHARYGVYATIGNVDGSAQMNALFPGLNIHVLDDEAYQISVPEGDLNLIGISYLGKERDEIALSQMNDSIPDTAYKILLTHTDDLIERAASLNINLYLAGHTHGGQVRLPFYGALITLSSHGKQYEAGEYQVKNTTLYISRGIGMAGSFAPRIRFLCPPELVVIDLVSK